MYAARGCGAKRRLMGTPAATTSKKSVCVYGMPSPSGSEARTGVCVGRPSKSISTGTRSSDTL